MKNKGKGDFAMSYAMTLGLFDWIGDFFKALIDLIPKIIYLLYASLATLLDVFQLFFRKLAGLDVYYIDGVPQSGDLVTNFIGGILGINFNQVTNEHPYPALTNVFWAMMLFGVIICFASMLIAIVKAHYSYDAKTTPKQIVLTGGRAIINMLAVPIIVLLGLFVSQALLTALDSITSVSSGQVEATFGNGINYFESTDTVQATTTEYKTIYVRATKYVSGKTYYGYNSETKSYSVVPSVTEENFSGLTLYEAKEVSVNTGSAREKTYIYYDIFGFGSRVAMGDTSGDPTAWSALDKKNWALIGSKNQTFSGALFVAAAYNSNRVRTGKFSKNGDFDFAGKDTFFSNAKDDVVLAEMVDICFANNMHLKDTITLSNWTELSSKTYFTNFATSWFGSFSKFNVGLVWYYYDLWQFNFIVGFAGCLVTVTIFVNIIFGLMTRLIMCLVLFLIAPPLFGLAPIKDAGKGWRENFIKQALMAYGAVVGMNLVMMILPYFNEIDFFNIPIVDYLVQTLFIIVGLISIKAIIETVSGLVGGADANKTGEGVGEDVAKVGMKAGTMALGAAKVGVTAQKAAFKGIAAAGNVAATLPGVRQAVTKYHDAKENKWNDRDLKTLKADNKNVETIRDGLVNGKTKKEVITDLVGNGMDKKEAKNLYKDIKAVGGKNGENIKGKSAAEIKLDADKRLDDKSKQHNEKKIVGWAGTKARLTRAGRDIIGTKNKDGKREGGMFQFIGQAGREGAGQMASNLGNVYGENKFGGYIKGEMKKSADKKKEKEAQKKQNKAEYLKLKQSGVADEDNPYFEK